MINDLFHDMVNQGNTATFINNIIVTTDTEKGHDEIVEEISRWLDMNNLFVCQTQKMQMEDERSRVLRSSDKT